jgi:hypothetical protein
MLALALILTIAAHSSRAGLQGPSVDVDVSFVPKPFSFQAHGSGGSCTLKIDGSNTLHITGCNKQEVTFNLYIDNNSGYKWTNSNNVPGPALKDVSNCKDITQHSGSMGTSLDSTGYILSFSEFMPDVTYCDVHFFLMAYDSSGNYVPIDPVYSNRPSSNPTHKHPIILPLAVLVVLAALAVIFMMGDAAKARRPPGDG